MLSTISSVTTELLAEIQQSWQKDNDLQSIIQQLTQGISNKHRHYTWTNQQLRRKGKLVVGSDIGLRNKIIALWHASSVGGHSGIHVTYKKLKSMFYWKHLHQHVVDFVAGCDTCQRYKPDLTAYPGLLQPLPIPTRVWTDISMDFIESLPKSQGEEVILVVVDRLSKYAHFMALSHPYTALMVAQIFMDHVFKLHGMPQTIVSDRGSVFLSQFWKELFNLQKVHLHYSSSYHPQTDGQTEVVNRCLENYLRCMTGEHPKEWVSWLPLAEYWYNTSYHSAIQSTPYQVVYGQPPHTHLPYLAGSSTVDSVDRSLATREKFIHSLKHNLHKAQHRMKQIADRRRTEREFNVGDQVYVKLQPY